MACKHGARFGGKALLWSSILAVAPWASTVVAPAYAEEADVIRVESTTIDDRFDSKRGEPSTTTVISGEAVDAKHPENIQQVLQSVPGVTTEFDSGDTLKIHIRGMENQVYYGEKPGVAIVIDGVPVFERTGRVNIDLDNIESIKVVKGGASYLFGDDALGGAVIITTKRGAKRAGYRVAGEYGSFGYWKGLGSAGFSNDQANGHVQVSRRAASGYYDDSAYRADYVDGNLQYYLGDSSDLTFGFEASERLKNSHGSVNGATAAENDPKSSDPAYNDYANHFDVHLGKYHLTYAKDFGGGTNWMLNGYMFTDHTKFDTAPVKNASAYTSANDYHQEQRGIKSEFRSGDENLGWLAAVDLRDNVYRNQVNTIATGALSSDNETDEKVNAAYGELKYRVANPLVVTLNGRYDDITLYYKDELKPVLDNDKAFSVTSWRAGANYALQSNTDLYANVSTGFRAPSVEQLFVGTASPTQKVDPNPRLKPEYSLNTEVGVRTRTAWGELPVEIEGSVFQLDRTDHIQANAGQYSTGPGNMYDNVGDTRSRGLELALRTDPTRTWSLDAAYTYLDATYTKYDNFNLRLARVGTTCPAGTTYRNIGGAPYCLQSMDLAGKQIPRVSPHHLNLAGHYRAAPGWLLTAEADTVSDFYADEPNLVKVHGHTTLNLLANYDFVQDQTKWALFARIDNVFDDRYWNTARGAGLDDNKDGVFNAEDISIVVNQGRTYTVGVSAAF